MTITDQSFMHEEACIPGSYYFVTMKGPSFGEKTDTIEDKD